MNDAIFEDIDADSNHFQIGNDFHLDLAERYYDSDWMIRFFNESDYRNSTMNSSLTHLNIIRSISSNIDEFIAMIKVNFDVNCLNETWLNSNNNHTLKITTDNNIFLIINSAL